MMCSLPFLFAQKNKLFLFSVFSALLMFYVNLGLPFRMRHKEIDGVYVNWMV